MSVKIIKIAFNCPVCAKKIAGSKRFAGKKILCPSCRSEILVPFEQLSSQRSLGGEYKAKGNSPRKYTVYSIKKVVFALIGVFFLCFGVFQGCSCVFVPSKPSPTKTHTPTPTATPTATRAERAYSPPIDESKYDVLNRYHLNGEFQGYSDPYELLKDMKELSRYGSKDAKKVVFELERAK